MEAVIIEDILHGRYGKRLTEGAIRIHKNLRKKLESANISESNFVQITGTGLTNLDMITQVSTVVDFQFFNNLNKKMATKYDKSETTARSLRELGNAAYKSKNFDLARKAYSKSILFASTLKSSNELSLGFANRSAVFYETKKYTLCLMDISRALETGYFPQSRLIDRARKCRGALYPGSNITETDIFDLESLLQSIKVEASPNNAEILRRKVFCEENIFRLISRNPSVPTAEDFVTINCSPERGRHIVTEKFVSPGTVLIVDKPYSKILLDELKWTTERCHYCHVQALHGIPCSSCTFAYYCSESCRKAAAGGHHRFECACASYFHQLMPTRIFMLALRTVTTLGPEAIIQLYQSSLVVQDPGAVSAAEIAGNDNGIYNSLSYTTIHNLVSHPDKCHGNELLSYIITSLSFVQILDTHSDFFQICGGNTELTSNLKSFTASLLLLHILNLPCNAHSLYALVGNLDSIEDDWIRTATAEEYGAGAFGVLSLINHSCDPNVVRVNKFDGQVAVIALKPLAAGAEVLDNYGHHYALEDLTTRRKALLSNYYFECMCLPCIENWPQLSQLRSLPPHFQCLQCVEKGHDQRSVALEEFGTDTLLCQRKTCRKKYSRRNLNVELDSNIDGFFVGHDMVLSNEPVEAISRVISSINYFNSRLRLPFVRSGDAEETYKQALNLIVHSAQTLGK